MESSDPSNRLTDTWVKVITYGLACELEGLMSYDVICLLSPSALQSYLNTPGSYWLCM